MITASLTTLPERQEALKDTVASLLPQVDKLKVYLHGYGELPEFLQDPKIEVAFDLEFGDRGDIDKTFWMKKVKGYHLLCDDDLIYPPGYAEQMVKAINKYKKKAVVSFHGAVMKQLPIGSYYYDRATLPCLGIVEEDTQVDIVGTGVLGYHTSCGLQEIELFGRFPNMLDIHISLWCKEQKIPLYTIAHPEGWIKHSEKVDLNKTIYARAVNDDFLQTSTINMNGHLFPKREMLPGLPIVSVVVINSRGKKEPQMLRQCFDSIRWQSYPNIEPVVVENWDKLITIGKAWNEAVKACRGDWVLFLGDDDYITPDYVQSLVATAYSGYDEKTVGFSSYLTMFTNINGIINQEPRQVIPTGMWKRQYLLEHPLQEYLTKYVDTELMDSCVEMGYKYETMKWHYGYYYRSHMDQVSGHKQLLSQDKNASWRTDEAREKLKRFRDLPIKVEIKND